MNSWPFLAFIGSLIFLVLFIAIGSERGGGQAVSIEIPPRLESRNLVHNRAQSLRGPNADTRAAPRKQLVPLSGCKPTGE